MPPSVALRTLLLLLPLAVVACSGSRAVQPNEYSNNDPQTGGQKFGNLGGGDSPIFSFGKNEKSDTGGGTGTGTGLGVNAYLWRGALDTLSFMPLSSADPFGGVIITDWFQPNGGTSERFKATAYILGRQLRADGVKVSLFRQVQQGGQWLDAPVSSGMTTELENKILTRARELRASNGS
jgi:hypothetical protein